MLNLIPAFLAAIRVFFRSRVDTSLEILALRQQVAVLKRKRPRPSLNRLDRFFWATLRNIWPRWSDVILSDGSVYPIKGKIDIVGREVESSTAPVTGGRNNGEAQDPKLREQREAAAPRWNGGDHNIRTYCKTAKPFRWTYTDPKRRIVANKIAETAY